MRSSATRPPRSPTSNREAVELGAEIRAEAGGDAVAIGMASAAGVPVSIAFTVETDRRLLSEEPLGEAIERVDAETAAATYRALSQSCRNSA